MIYYYYYSYYHYLLLFIVVDCLTRFLPRPICWWGSRPRELGSFTNEFAICRGVRGDGSREGKGKGGEGGVPSWRDLGSDGCIDWAPVCLTGWEDCKMMVVCMCVCVCVCVWIK